MILGLLLGVGGSIFSGVMKYKGEKAAVQRENEMIESQASQRRRVQRRSVADSSSSGAGMVDTMSFNTDLLNPYESGSGSEYIAQPSGWGIFASTVGSFLNSNIGQDFLGGRYKGNKRF